MNNDARSLMDPMNWHILAELQADARLSMAQLARKVGISAPATTQRVHRLEDAGVIRGYRALVDPRALGRQVLAFVRINAGANIKEKVRQTALHMPEILECHRGGECFLLKVSAKSNEHLESISDRFIAFGILTTTVILSSLLENRTIDNLHPIATTRSKESIT